MPARLRILIPRTARPRPHYADAEHNTTLCGLQHVDESRFEIVDANVAGYARLYAVTNRSMCGTCDNILARRKKQARQNAKRKPTRKEVLAAKLAEKLAAWNAAANLAKSAPEYDAHHVQGAKAVVE
jgi:hypothetical protein